MKHFIQDLEIQNFKTIKKVKLKCKRINLFVGKPNVGKSNVLEALALVSLSNINYDYFQRNIENDTSYSTEAFRADNIANLFYFFETHNPVKIISNDFTTTLQINPSSPNEFVLSTKFQPHHYNGNQNQGIAFDSRWNKIGMGSSVTEHFASIKHYLFKPLKNFPVSRETYLLPPYGGNLWYLLLHNRKFYSTIQNLFKEYAQRIKLTSEVNGFFIRVETKLPRKAPVEIPYDSIADTLQRYIFHYLAINSNKNSILLFEEPEAHSFPPYIQKIALEIKNSKTNQFFITTHSPFILNNIVESTPKDEVAVFKVSYEKHQTEIEELTDKEMAEYFNYGTDIFFHLK